MSDRRGTLKQAITNIVDHQDILSRNLNEESLRTDASASTLAEFLIHQDEYIKIESGKKDFSIETSHEYNKLMEKLKTYIHETQSMETIQHAFEIAQKAHEEQIGRAHV